MFGELSSASPLPLSENLCFLEVLVLLSSLSSHLVLVSRSRLETGCNSNVDVRRYDEPAKLLTMNVLAGEVELLPEALANSFQAERLDVIDLFQGVTFICSDVGLWKYCCYTSYIHAF